MQQSDLLDAVKTLTDRLESDPSLSEEVKDSVMNVVMQAFNDPTPGNFEALATLMHQLGKMHRFANAVDLISGATD